MVRSHKRVSVGASRGPDLGRDTLLYGNNIISGAIIPTSAAIGLHWLVRSHRRVSVSASRNLVWVVTNLVSEY